MTKTDELASVTRKVLRRVEMSLLGCISRPRRNSRKMMPNSAISVRRLASEI